MSYDILILDPHPRFKKGDEFISWYDRFTQWNEDYDYNDWSHSLYDIVTK